MFCSFCGTKEKADSIFCSKCGSKLSASENMASDANVLEADSTHFQPVQKSKPKLALVFVAAATVIAAIGLVLAFQSNQVTEEAYVPPTPAVIEEPIIDKSWVPAGFEWQSDDFATKWVTQEGDWPCSDCNFWKLKVVPQYDCSNGVYAELNMLDFADTVVDWSNDSLPSLSAGQTGLLVFKNYPYDDGIVSGQLTELKCNR